MLCYVMSARRQDSAANSNLNSKKLGIVAELAHEKISLLSSNKTAQVLKTKFQD